MATIKYNGMELEEFTSDKPVFFDKPVGALIMRMMEVVDAEA